MSDTPQTMSIPAAIIVAGILIAGAVYFSQVGPRQAVTQTVPEATRPVASLDTRPITSEDHARGPENAKITILEYSDLECPYCKIFHQSMLQLMKDHPNDIRWVFRHSPIPELHPNAPAIASAAECAGKQGKFWEFTDVAFKGDPTDGGMNLADLPTHAQEAGVADIAAFQSCVAENGFTDKIQKDIDDGLKAGLQGTPFNMVITADGKKTQLGGGIGYSQLKAVIEPLL